MKYRKKNIAILAGLLTAQIILLSTQGTRNRIESFALRALGPVIKASNYSAAKVRNFANSVSLLNQTRRSNFALRLENKQLKQEIARLQVIEFELDRNERIKKNANRRSGLVANVVYLDQRSWLQTLILHAEGLDSFHNQPVITMEGLVGRVIVPAGPYAKVQLITDRSAAVGAMIKRTRRRGIVRGWGNKGMVLDHIPLSEDVNRGDLIVTAGIDGIYPRGITIGTVKEIRQGNELFHRIHVSPSIKFSLLEEVYILSDTSIPQSAKAILLEN